RVTTAVWSPRKSCVSTTPDPNRARSTASIAAPSISGAPRAARRGSPLPSQARLPRRVRLHLGRAAASRSHSIPLGLGGAPILRLHEPVDDGLRAGRAARDVDVHGDDRVDALDGRVVVVEAAGGRAEGERADP